jgi:hypothetical protein
MMSNVKTLKMLEISESHVQLLKLQVRRMRRSWLRNNSIAYWEWVGEAGDVWGFSAMASGDHSQVPHRSKPCKEEKGRAYWLNKGCTDLSHCRIRYSGPKSAQMKLSVPHEWRFTAGPRLVRQGILALCNHQPNFPGGMRYFPDQSMVKLFWRFAAPYSEWR